MTLFHVGVPLVRYGSGSIHVGTLVGWSVVICYVKDVVRDSWVARVSGVYIPTTFFFFSRHLNFHNFFFARFSRHF